MNLVPYEQIALVSEVTTRTIARDVARGLLKSRRLDGNVLIDADAAAEHISARKAAQALRGKS